MPDGTWYCERCDEQNREFDVDGELYGVVEEFEYLGSIQSASTTSTAAIRHRIAKATKAFGMLTKLWRSRMKWHVKGAVYCSMVRSVLLYASETWTTTSADLQELETFEMACLRRIARTSLLAHRTSESVRQQLRIGTSIADVVRQSRLRYLGHVLRMDRNRQPYIVLRTALDSKNKGRGRPRKTWVQCVTEDLKSRSLNMIDVERILAPCHGGDEAEVVRAKGEYRRRVVYGIKSTRDSRD